VDVKLHSFSDPTLAADVWLASRPGHFTALHLQTEKFCGMVCLLRTREINYSESKQKFLEIPARRPITITAMLFRFQSITNTLCHSIN